MKQSVVVVCGVIAFLVLASFFIRDTDTIVNYPPKNGTIVAFGDSLIEGVGASEGNDIPSVLARSLQRTVVNLGVSGNTTRDGVARMGEVRKYDPGVVLLLLGGNDYLKRMSEEETHTNLETLITTFQSHGAVVVLLGVRGGVLRDGRASMYEEIAQTYGAVYVSDVLAGILLSPELMYDAIHPNDAGYRIIADRLTEVFRDYAL